MDIAVVNSYRVFEKLETRSCSLLEFKETLMMTLVQNYSSRLRRPLNKNTFASKTEKMVSSSHLPIFVDGRLRCFLCSKDGVQNRTAIKCQTCDVALCLNKERNCFFVYHS